jgi:hypothetical protein
MRVVRNGLCSWFSINTSGMTSMNQLTTRGLFDLLYYQSKKVDVGSDSAHLHTEEKANPVNKYPITLVESIGITV